MIRYLRAHFIHSEYPCRLFHFSKLRNHSSLSLFAKRGKKKNNTSLFTENRSALCWSRGYTHRLRLLTHPQPFPPSLVYATISSTLSICHSCLSQKGFHFLLFLCSALSRPLLFMRAHWGPGRPGKGNKWMPQAPQGWTCLAPWTEGLGIGVHLYNPEVTCSGVLPCSPPPLPHLKTVSLALTLLRTALRKSLEMSDIYQDRKGRFGKRSVLLTHYSLPDSFLEAHTAFLSFCFCSENASINGLILHQLLLLWQPVRKLGWRGIRNLE